jgi:hypothetical protein
VTQREETLLKGMSRKAVRLLAVATGALSVAAMTAVPALAQYPPTEAPTGVAPPGAGEVAFTGANITLWMVLLAGLVIGGTLALIVGRRRSKSSA